MDALTLDKSPVRRLTKKLLHRFMIRIVEKCDEEEGDIPELSNPQWRTVSAVIATYRALCDEHFQQEQIEQGRISYKDLSIEELHFLVAKFKAHPTLANVGQIDEPINVPRNGDRP